MAKIAVVTGAGSGVGRSVAQKLAAAGWTVALVGRRESPLGDTAGLNPERMSAYPCDISNAAAVDRAFSAIRNQLGPVELLVNAAGTNVPQRSLEHLSVADYQEIINTNLNGSFYWVRAVLPEMRANRSGTIVNIVSDAGLTANTFSGAAYAASKFGQTGLTQAINAEERKNGIRAIAISPGEIDTPILEKRPNPPSMELRARMLKPEDVADCVVFVVSLPGRAIVEQLVIRPA
jgi:NAD(P)-dependent dehydrogenase (short-subunit alcohol dehydrogenase family)